MQNPKKLIPPQLDQLAILGEIPVRSIESYEQKEEVEETEKKPEKKKSSGVEQVREGLRKKRKKTSFEYSERIIDFDKLDTAQKNILRTVVDPKRIDARLPISKTEAEVREFYHTHHGNNWERLKDALWLVTFGAISGTERAIKKDLRRIRKGRNFDVLYYPGSGYDVVPRDAFGGDRVIHLSLEERDSYYRMKHAQDSLRGYEKQDMELVGDFRNSPLKDTSVDAVIIKGIPIHSAIEAKEDFERVLKDDGVLLFVNDRSIVDMEILRKEINRKFIKISQKGCIEIYQKRIISK